MDGAVPANASPMVQTYAAARTAAPEHLVLYRVGEFYEILFDDAAAVSRLLGITLTRRQQKNGTYIPMCGIPAGLTQIVGGASGAYVGVLADRLWTLPFLPWLHVPDVCLPGPLRRPWMGHGATCLCFPTCWPSRHLCTCYVERRRRGTPPKDRSADGISEWPPPRAGNVTPGTLRGSTVALFDCVRLAKHKPCLSSPARWPARHGAATLAATQNRLFLLMSDDTLEVEAKITEWRTGEHGPYAIARVLSADAPVKTALCGQDVKGVTPVPGAPFRCWIKRTHRGWRVTEIIVDGLTHDLVDVAGIVRAGSVRRGRGMVWTVQTEPLAGGVAIVAELDISCLRAVRLAEIDVGTPIRFDAVRGARGYEAAKLLYPTPAEAFPSDPAGVARQTVVALVGQDWTADDPKKGVPVRMRSAAGASVSASTFVRASMLRAAGLKRLFRASGPTPAPEEESEEQLSEWETMLRSDARDIRDRVEIDRLEIEVEWVASSSQWRVGRLLRPRALRMPAGLGEVVDWVHGTVLGEPRRVAKIAQNAEPKKADDAEEERETLGPGMQSVVVDVEYEDVRVGYGAADLRLAEHRAQAAGLAPGVPVVVCLKSREDYWNIIALHRSRPVEAETLP